MNPLSRCTQAVSGGYNVSNENTCSVSGRIIRSSLRFQCCLPSTSMMEVGRALSTALSIIFGSIGAYKCGCISLQVALKPILCLWSF